MLTTKLSSCCVLGRGAGHCASSACSICFAKWDFKISLTASTNPWNVSSATSWLWSLPLIFCNVVSMSCTLKTASEIKHLLISLLLRSFTSIISSLRSLSVLLINIFLMARALSVAIAVFSWSCSREYRGVASSPCHSTNDYIYASVGGATGGIQ